MNEIAVSPAVRRLDNGLTVVLAPDPSVPIVAVNLWYAVGSRDEREGETGLAHLFEHMMFQGSANVPKGAHFAFVESAGGSMNASTWFDRTNYFETLPAHCLDLALWLESDRMGWLLPALDQEKLDNQREVVRNEKRQVYDNRPYGDWQERIQALLFPPGHPYHHTVIGSMEDLGAATLEDVERFFRSYYTPGNAVLTLAGDFAPDDALDRVRRYFGEIPRGAPAPPVPEGAGGGSVPGGPRLERLRAAVPLPRVYAALPIPAFTDPAFPVADVAASVLGDGRASRLYRRLVRERRIAKDASAHAYPLVTGGSFMVVRATGLADTDPDLLEEAVGAELDALGRVTAEEVDRAVARTGTALLRMVEGTGTRADLLSMYQSLFGDASRLAGEIGRLRAVGPREVEAFASSSLGPANRVVVTYVPEAA